MSSDTTPQFVRPATGARADGLLDSTEAARTVQARPTDPLWQRYDQLRASGALRPVTLDPVALFNPHDVARAARPWDFPAEPEDEGEPARDVWRPVLIATAVGVAVWALFGAAVWAVTR